MKYLQSLADHLIANVLKKDDVTVWAEDGELLFSGHVIEDGFEIRYTCNIEMSNVELAPIRLFMLIASWVNKTTPERDSQGLPAPQFFTERLANGRYDLGIKIQFIEQFNFEENPDGDWSVDGVLMSLNSDFDNLLDIDSAKILKIVDSHTQDNGLQN